MGAVPPDSSASGCCRPLGCQAAHLGTLWRRRIKCVCNRTANSTLWRCRRRVCILQLTQEACLKPFGRPVPLPKTTVLGALRTKRVPAGQNNPKNGQYKERKYCIHTSPEQRLPQRMHSTKPEEEPQPTPPKVAARIPVQHSASIVQRGCLQTQSSTHAPPAPSSQLPLALPVRPKVLPALLRHCVSRLVAPTSHPDNTANPELCQPQ